MPTFQFEVLSVPKDNPGWIASSMDDVERLADFAFKQGIINGCRIKDDATGLEFKWRPVSIASG